ncbi:hypothetical protein WOLCODRAFT_28668 [Wolfiporia cocos MD-104 SS10]|uniref:Uncharacterized protein n=1 Tax=Wolfiporia cocos (strain MD-104) TaxID=742152 RepID=A0A2H3J3P8_WOLCO|nr:hypothetical protein WOLCODRAFT_28668 [Wolfiporia cocos MD-104 SS10]
MHDYKHAERPAGQHQAASPPVPTPAPQPYQYGVVGRPLPAGTTVNVPHTPDPSRSHSPSVLTSYSPPPSASFRTSITPLPGARTAITPGPSIASSSRASTPGLVPAYPSQLQQYHHELQQQQYQQQYQSQQARLSWPRYGGSEDGYDERRSPAQRARSERRPSRLSLTLANWNPETDGELGDIGVQEIDSSGGPTEVTVEETSQTGWSQSAASSAGDVQRRADSGPPEAPSNAPT